MSLFNSSSSTNEIMWRKERWRKERYIVVQPPRCNDDQRTANLLKKTHLNQVLEHRVQTMEERTQIECLFSILKVFLDETHKDVKWTVRDLKRYERGVYLLGIRDTNDSTFKFKIGMSLVDCAMRVRRQPHSFGALIASHNELSELVPDTVVGAIQDLNLPGLSFHSDHCGSNGYRESLIRMQLVEMLYACTFECITETVCERLFQLPSRKVRNVLRERTFTNDEIAFMAGIQDHSISCILTWKTLPTRLQELKAEGSEFLQRQLRDAPTDGFLKLYLIKKLFGPLFWQWEDAVRTCPRELELQQVISNLNQATNPREYRDALTAIKGDNYSHYVHPTNETLAKGALDVLNIQMCTLPIDKTIYMERCSFDAIESVYGINTLNKSIDMKNGIMEVKEDKSLRLLRTRSGHRMIITPSFFKAMGQEASVETRFKAIESYFILLQLFCVSGKISQREMIEQKNHLCSFLMTLEGFVDDDDDDDEESKTLSNETSDSGGCYRSMKMMMIEPRKIKIYSRILSKNVAKLS